MNDTGSPLGGPPCRTVTDPMHVLKSLLCAATLSLAGAASAATVTLGGDTVMNCGLTLRGQITEGDADKIDAAARNLPTDVIDLYRKQRLCLDSPGGSYPEGVAIAKLLKDIGLGTAIAASARCESACAIAFMGGTMHGEEGLSQVHRLLHPKGKLGIHAPSVDVPDRAYEKHEVDRSFQIALDAIATLMLARTEGLDFPESMMIAMLRTPPKQMHYVTTTGQAAQWQIALFPIALPGRSTSELAATACDIGSDIVDDTAPTPRAYTDHSPAFLARQTVENGTITLLTSPNYRGEATSRCELTFLDRNVYANGRLGYFRFVGDRDERLHNLYRHMFYPSDTPISALNTDPSGPLTDVAALAERVSTAPPPPPHELYTSCTLQGQTAEIANVKTFVNLRRSASLSAPILREVPFGERVTLTGAPVVGQDWAGRAQGCVDLCNRWQSNRRDTDLSRAAAQCVADNVIWYPVRDARGNAGWLSRKYLEQSW